MNNLHRELAPISDSAWAEIEEETSRTLKRYLAGRRVVDLKGPAGAARPLYVNHASPSKVALEGARCFLFDLCPCRIGNGSQLAMEIIHVVSLL